VKWSEVMILGEMYVESLICSYVAVRRLCAVCCVVLCCLITVCFSFLFSNYSTRF